MSRPRKNPLPSIQELNRRFAYDPLTGDLTTREREGDDPYIAAYNRRYANKVIGTLQNAGYRFINVAPFGMMLAHRIAWAIHYGEWPGELDHKDGNKLNNRIENLREATRGQNTHNRPGSALSGYKGVRKSPKCANRYTATIHCNGRTINLGSFGSAEEAHEAYKAGAIKYHGEFANFDVRRVGIINATISFGVRE